MSVVRLEAFRALERLIACEIPELEGRICTGQAPSGEVQEYPHLVIDPGTLSYEPQQSLESATLPGGRVVFNVGAHSGPVQLRLMATSVGERAELEQRVLDVFLGQVDDAGFGRPGVIALPVTWCADLGHWTASFELDDDTWNDAKAFERKLESIITTRCVLPALATRCGAYSIRDLRLGITQDMDTTITPTTMVPPAVEVVRVNEDGTLTPIP